MAEPVAGDSFVPALKALAEPNRWRMLQILASGEHRVSALAQLVGVSEPTASHHLAKLQSAGLVTLRKAGTTHYYRINTEAIQALWEDGLAPLARAAPAPMPTGHGPEPVAAPAAPAAPPSASPPVENPYPPELASCFSGGRIPGLPADEALSNRLLTWLASHYEPGREYGHVEVNRVLMRFSGNTAPLRRALVEGGWLQRREDKYWRE